VPRSTSAGGTLFTEPVLVVNQKAKIIEVTNQYSVYDQHGRSLGSVNEVGQSTLRKAFRLLSNYDQYLTHKFEVKDAPGPAGPQRRPPGQADEVRVIREPPGQHRDRAGYPEETSSGRSTFALVAPDGSPGRRDPRAELAGLELPGRRRPRQRGRQITKTWEGFAKALFTTATTTS